MRELIKIDDLPDFDAALYLDSGMATTAYLTDILEANDAGLLAAATQGLQAVGRRCNVYP